MNRLKRKPKKQSNTLGDSSLNGDDSLNSKENALLEFHITKDTLLAELLNFPELYEELYRLGVPCIACPLANFEANFLTLEGIASMYNLKLDKLIKDLNQALIKLRDKAKSDNKHSKTPRA